MPNLIVQPVACRDFSLLPTAHESKTGLSTIVSLCRRHYGSQAKSTQGGFGKTTKNAHRLHSAAAGGTGERVRENTLPGCSYKGTTGALYESTRRQNTGKMVTAAISEGFSKKKMVLYCLSLQHDRPSEDSL